MWKLFIFIMIHFTNTIDGHIYEIKVADLFNIIITAQHLQFTTRIFASHDMKTGYISSKWLEKHLTAWIHVPYLVTFDNAT